MTAISIRNSEGQEVAKANSRREANALVAVLDQHNPGQTYSLKEEVVPYGVFRKHSLDVSPHNMATSPLTYEEAISWLNAYVTEKETNGRYTKAIRVVSQETATYVWVDDNASATVWVQRI